MRVIQNDYHSWLNAKESRTNAISKANAKKDIMGPVERNEKAKYEKNNDVARNHN
jgi:hypothetical protein